jgi:excisionase family DNA binding protein
MIEKLLLSYKEAYGLLGISLRTLSRLVEGGEIRPVRVQGSPRIARSELDRYLQAITSEASSKAAKGGKPDAAS